MDSTLKLIKAVEDVKEEPGEEENIKPAEIKKTKTYITIENEKKTLEKELQRVKDRVDKLLKGQVVPQKNIEEWREKFFVICEHLDELRDELRKVWEQMNNSDLVNLNKRKK